MNSKDKKIEYQEYSGEDFARLLGVNFSDFSKECRKLIETLDFRYRFLSSEERDAILLRVIKRIYDPGIIPSGSTYIEKWETGWSENRKNYEATGDLNELLPKFVKKQEVVRLDGKYIQPFSEDFETSFVNVIRQYVFETFLNNSEVIYEFGCGTGHNLVHLSRIFPGKKLIGLDWSEESCRLIDAISEKEQLNLTSLKFDMFNPPIGLNVSKGSALFTVGAMEQLGGDYKKFLEFILSNNFSICVHLETAFELYDESNIFDYVAKEYLVKRNWLRGFFSELTSMQEKGELSILYQKRTFGSLFHDGYTITAWAPKHV